MKRIKNIAVYLLLIMLCAQLLAFPEISCGAAKEAVMRCLNILIPSLFVFMASASLLIKSGAYKVISLPFYPIAKYVFKMPYELFSVVLISNIAGFPIGASMLSSLVDEGRIDRKTASIMQCFCYGGGPSFSVGVIGLALFKDKTVGYIICLSGFLANILFAFFICRIFKLKINDDVNHKSFSSGDIISCTEKAGCSMLMICALVIIFCVIMADIQELGTILLRNSGYNIPHQAGTLIKTIFEVSSISQLTNARAFDIPLIASLFSFGGVCVLMQIIAAVNGRYSLNMFFITRLPISIMSLFIAKVLCEHLLDNTKYCIAVSDDFIVNFNNFIPSICLILMIFLLLFKKGVAFFRDI